MKKEWTCIICPIGCSLVLEATEEGEIVSVQGNRCPRGTEYAKQEFLRPMRMLTTTMRIRGAMYPRIPVVSSAALPKDDMMLLMEKINHGSCTAPVEVGEVLMKDPLGIGVDVLASRSMRKEEGR